MKFSIKGFFSKCDQIRGFLRIWSHLLKKSLMEKFIFCAVYNLFFSSCNTSDYGNCLVILKDWVVVIEHFLFSKLSKTTGKISTDVLYKMYLLIDKNENVIKIKDTCEKECTIEVPVKRPKLSVQRY